jgi:hypothetical protein
MRARAIQLLSRYLALGLLALATKIGVSAGADTVSGYAEMIASGLVGVVLIFVDHWLHNRQAKS